MNLLGIWPTVGSTGKAVFFSITTIIVVAYAFGVLFFKKAAYAAISIVGVMLGLAVLYIAEQAPFLGIVQVVVYTSATMIFFLFVIMMIDISATDDHAIQSKSLIVAAILAGLGLAVIIISAIAHITLAGEAVGLEPKNPYSDESIIALATTLLSEHWLTMKVAGALLITAAIGVMLLTHSNVLGPKISQCETTKARVRAFTETKCHIGQLSVPGVYTHSNAVGVPAISGETLASAEESVPRVIRVRGLDRRIEQVNPRIAQLLMLVRRAEIIGSSFAPETSATIPLSGSWGMSGPTAPNGLDQPLAPSTEEDAAPASTQKEEK